MRRTTSFTSTELLFPMLKMRQGALAAGGVRVVGVPSGLWRWRARHQPRDRLHYIIDVGEISSHLAVVEQLHWSAMQDGINEQPDRHVGATPWAIDGEES